MSNDELEMDEMQALVKKAQDGDSAAFDRLYERYVTPIFRYIYIRVKSKEDAEDIVQTVFLKAWNALPKYKELGRPFSSWLYAIARNATIDYWKERKDILVDEPEVVFQNIKDESQSIERMIAEKDIAAAVGRIVNTLEGDQRDVIVLKFVEDLSNKEIAKLLSKSEEAVRQIQCRAIRKLRDRFKNINIL